jgi:glycosyltransferase involved in cell wall biosynthesis
MLLSILIPTYNRANYLEKNLYMLEKYITNNNLVDDVKIIVSNNHSQDNTKDILDKFSKRDKIKIDIYHQEDNLGLERNVLFVLSKAKSEYVITLGDDDYLNEKYLINIINKLKTNQEIYCVIPSIKGLNPEGNIINSGRDLNIESKIYNSGFSNCLKNSWRGHQISGLAFKREMVLSSYKKNKVNNLYPQIYFVAFNCLRGKTWHFTDYPVKSTAAIQEDKDWGYGKDGLILEIFDNYKKIDNITKIQRSKLELKILNIHKFRYQMYLSKGVRHYLEALRSIEFGNNTSLLTKLIFPFLAFKHLSKTILVKVLKSILGNDF